ncbi:MAG: helix-turn-helix domain-containing protein [Roseburia sp.]|nr:helix-turn-helix domain-containing protein [Roseburia sp.]MCM1242844.1 helix-turn-helix domain-containing protein [Roseburia sp.]
MELHNLYRPITATPFKKNEQYMEFEPCAALKPYIRCFWGTKQAFRQTKSEVSVKDIVTPDTCADIIFTADLTANKIENRFCGIDDRTFSTDSIRNEDKTVFSFAIRFYAWSAAVFAEDSLKNTKNAFFDVGYHFLTIKKEIEKYLFDVTDISELISIAEKVLLQRLCDRHNYQTVWQAVCTIVEKKGNLSVSDLEQELLTGSRQLQRLFGEYVGVSPKSLASMVRYQCLWSDIIYHKNFDILDAVYKYGYSDQAHLCHDFKKYHSMNIAEARKYALQSVGNVQDVLP